MEDMAEVYIKDFVNKHNGRYLTQTNFAKASKEFGVDVPIQQANKKGDFMLLIDGKPINIETNLQQKFGPRVRLTRSKRGGKIIIPYRNDEELDRIYQQGYERLPEESEIGEAQIGIVSEIFSKESW